MVFLKLYNMLKLTQDYFYSEECQLSKTFFLSFKILSNCTNMKLLWFENVNWNLCYVPELAVNKLYLRCYNFQNINLGVCFYMKWIADMFCK